MSMIASADSSKSRYRWLKQKYKPCPNTVVDAELHDHHHLPDKLSQIFLLDLGFMSVISGSSLI